MTRKTSRLSFSSSPVPPAFALPAWSRDEYTRHFDRTVPMSNGEALHLEHTFGAVTIQTHSSSQCCDPCRYPRFGVRFNGQARQYAGIRSK